MKQHERAQIEILLKRGFSIPQIARELNRPAMTITREIKNRRIDSNKGVKERNAICVHFADCTRRDVCRTNCGLRVRCRNCEMDWGQTTIDERGKFAFSVVCDEFVLGRVVGCRFVGLVANPSAGAPTGRGLRRREARRERGELLAVPAFLGA